eukprot:SAG31_NODE_16412_length_710_cov_0.977087_1_plen_72_part_01
MMYGRTLSCLVEVIPWNRALGPHRPGWSGTRFCVSAIEKNFMATLRFPPCPAKPLLTYEVQRDLAESLFVQR